MSTFIDIVCYDSGGPELGNIVRLTRKDLEQLAADLPKYNLHDTDRTISIQLPGCHVHAVLERRGILTCQLDQSTDVSMLLDALRELASHLPGAVVQDKEGEVY